MRRVLGLLLAFALALGQTPARAATTVPRAAETPPLAAAPLGPMGLNAGASLGDALPGNPLSAAPISSLGADVPAQPPALAQASETPASIAAEPSALSAPLFSDGIASHAPEASVAAQAGPDAGEKPGAREELHRVAAEGAPSKPGGSAAQRAFYDGSPRPAGLPADGIDESAALLGQLELVRAGTAGPLPDAAKQSRYVLIPGLNWDLLGSEYFRPNLRRLEELGLSASMVRTDPLAKAAANVDAIRAALESSDVPAIVITHSKGGPDLDEALKRLPHLWSKIRHIVTIQAPHRGTQAADFFSSDAARLWFYTFVMAVGRLLNPRRIVATSFSHWHDGVRELSTRHRAGLSSALRAAPDGVGVFSIATRARPSSLVARLKALLFRALHENDNDGLVPTAGSIVPGSRYAVLDDVGHMAPISAPTWRTKLAATAAPYADFAAHLTEAIVRWVHSDGLVPVPAPVQTAAKETAAVAPQVPGKIFRSHLRRALVLGMSLAIFAPALWTGVRLTALSYQAPTAFLLAAALGLAVYAPHALAWSIWHALAAPAWIARQAARGIRGDLPRLTPPFPRSPAALLALGSALGAAAGTAVTLAFSSSASPLLLHIALTIFSAAAFAWAGYQAFRLLRPLARLSFGAAKRISSSLSPSKSVSFAAGALFGLAFTGLPFLIPYFPRLLTGQTGIVVLLMGWILWTLSESLGVIRDSARALWRSRFDMLPHKKNVLRYAARLLLGLGLGAVPILFPGPIVKLESRLLESAAREVAARKDLMEQLPRQWQWAVRLAAEATEMDEGELFRDAVYLETPNAPPVGRLDSRTLARVYTPADAKGKHLTILISGGAQTVDDPGNASLMAGLYHALSARGEPVIWFRSGDPLLQLHGRTEADGKFVEDAEIVAAHTKKIAAKIIRDSRPSGVSIVGYSWGGGEIVDLSKDQSWLQGSRVERTIAIDPIRTSLASMGEAETRRPDFNGNRHTQIYQQAPPRGDWWNVTYWMHEQGWSLDLSRTRIEIHGAPLADPRRDDRSEQVQGTDHMGIELDAEVQGRVLRYLRD
ncbi:MAG TPA: hypothetical protein VNI01_16620 [Elusimicrobiota bacterium]|nr:hypothetical protein [Elusimicrobiota bacterium]